MLKIFSSLKRPLNYYISLSVEKSWALKVGVGCLGYSQMPFGHRPGGKYNLQLH